MRLFVALSLPPRVRWTLSELCGGLPGARWVQPENFHITLRFIGEVSRYDAREIDYLLSQIDCPAFELTLKGVGTFDEGKRRKCLWVGIEADERLQRLQAKVDQMLLREGFVADRRKFKPHITLARFKSNPPEPKLQEFMNNHSLLRMGPIQVDDFVLYSSILAHEGSHYTAEAIYPLAGVPAY